MTLKEELTEIHGIGEKKADQIIEVVEQDYDPQGQELVQEAIDYLEEGHVGYARKYLEKIVK